MIPLKTTIRGFGPHEDTTVEWANLKSPIAITGPTGTGKTWLMETIIAVLFGEFAWYSSSIYNGLTLGGTGTGHLEMDFEHNGVAYRAQRIVKDSGKTKTQKAYLYLLDISSGMTGKMIAGPKTKDFDRAIFAMIGDKKTFLATCFLAQCRSMDLCGQPGEKNLVALRREIFNALIGADALDEVEKRFARVAKKSKIIATELEAQLVGEDDPAEAVTKITGELTGALINLELKRKELHASEQNLEDARTRLRDAEGGDGALRAQINEHEQNQRSSEEYRDRVSQFIKELYIFESRVSKLEAAQEDARRLEEFTAMRGRLREEKSWYDAWAECEHQRSALEFNLDSWAREIKSLQCVPGVDEKTVALAARVKEFHQKYREAVLDNDKIQQWNQAADKKRTQLRAELASLLDRRGQINVRLSEQKETLFGEKCKPCPFIAEWTKLPEELSALNGEIKIRRLELDGFAKNDPEIDIAAIKADSVEAETAQKSVVAAASTRERLRDVEVGAKSATAALEEHKALYPLHEGEPPCDDPSVKIDDTQTAMDSLAGAPERVENCKRAESAAYEKRGEIEEARERLDEFSTRANDTSEKAVSARRVLENLERQREVIHAEVEGKTKTLQGIREEVAEEVTTIARCETRLDDLEKRAADRQEKSERVRKLRADLDGYADLRKCFGPRGVRAILIDNSAPDLEAIANDLFKRATGGQMALRIATQAANADGSIAETFDILVTDKTGERDVLEYSGGELQLILILFRVAQSIWIGNLREKQPDSLFFDEAMTGMDPEWAESIMRLFEYIKDKIKMIVVITHNIDIAARMQSRIRLEKRFGGVKILKDSESYSKPEPIPRFSKLQIERGILETTIDTDSFGNKEEYGTLTTRKGDVDSIDLLDRQECLDFYELKG